MEETALSDDFTAFLDNKIDRTAFIVNYLESRGLPVTVINLKGKKHIYLNFDSRQYNGLFRLKTLIAHYDRVPDSPGANDNSFAVFTMMNWALHLNEQGIQHNIRIIFTDGEENAPGSDIKNQGAYELGFSLKKNTSAVDYYVFDCMGRGTIPVLAKPPVLKKASLSFKKSYNALFHRSEEILQKALPGSWVTLPVSWSDNAGLTAQGLPSVLITMLPKEEASFYMLNLTKNPELENFVINHEITAGDTKSHLNALLPKTWLFLHSDYDCKESITYESTACFERILNAIALSKTPS